MRADSRGVWALIFLMASACAKEEKPVVHGDWFAGDTVLSISDSLVIFSPVLEGLRATTRNGSDLIDDGTTITPIPKGDDSVHVAVSVSGEAVVYKLKAPATREARRAIQVKRIIFSALGCFGSCPVLNFEVDDQGTCYYEGTKYVKQQGMYTAQGRLDVFNLLQDKVRNIEVHRLDTLYASPVTDAEDFLLKIYYDDEVRETHVYGHHQEPAALRLLLMYLTGLPEYIAFQPAAAHHFETTEKIPEPTPIRFLPPQEK